MKKLIIANWKMNPRTVEEAVTLAKESDVAGLVVAPPFVFLAAVAAVLTKSSLGAQDLSAEEQGAHTGEVSGQELAALGVKYVIVGHSERRRLGETDDLIAKKVAAAFRSGLTPILCVGETAEERKSGRMELVVKQQVTKGLSEIEKATYSMRQENKISSMSLAIAYEPVWAIGTGTPDTPENMMKMTKFIKDTLVASTHSFVTHIIYGGSVTAENAARYLMHEEIGGALVGGASLKTDEIKKIVDIAAQYTF